MWHPVGTMVATLLAAAPASPAVDRIAFASSMWGAPLVVWSVSRTGRGRYAETENLHPHSVLDYDVTVRAFRVHPAEWRRLAAILGPVHPYAKQPLACRRSLDDPETGSLTWTSSGATERFRFVRTCRSDEADRVYAALDAASRYVARLARRGRVAAARHVRGGEDGE